MRKCLLTLPVSSATSWNSEKEDEKACIFVLAIALVFALGTAASSIAAAEAADDVWVAAGTYKPTNGTSRIVSIVPKSGVAVYGRVLGRLGGRSGAGLVRQSDGSERRPAGAQSGNAALHVQIGILEHGVHRRAAVVQST